MKSVKHHSKLTQTLLQSLAFFLIFLVSFSTYSQDVDEARQKEGKKLFKSLCASCHKLDKKLIGPALGAVEERRETAAGGSGFFSAVFFFVSSPSRLAGAGIAVLCTRHSEKKRTQVVYLTS